MNLITLVLEDAEKLKTYELLEVPLVEAPVAGTTEVETLDGNVSTYFSYHKRIWRHKWAYMTKEEYEELKGFYDRQFIRYGYPLLTIEHLGVKDQPVLMKINKRDIVNNCGMVSGVEVTFRETRQLSDGVI